MKKILLLFIATIILFHVDAQIIYVSEDFNASALPSGWTTAAVSGTQVWSFGLDGSIFHPGNQNLTNTAMAYFDDDALGAASTSNTASLLSPVFDNSANTISFLEFDYNFREINSISDSFYVDVYDGTNWQRVFSRSANDCGSYLQMPCINKFPKIKIDISAYKNVNCQVRFTYHDGNDWGWYVGLDNINVFSPFETDLTITEIIRPLSTCNLGSQDTVEITVKNVGIDTINAFQVFFDVDNGGQLINETIQTILLPGDTLNIVFSSTVNLSQLKSYQLKAYCQNALDTNQLNDTIINFIQNDTVYSGNYFEDFETANHGWTFSGINSSWAWGTPNTTNINKAVSGINALITNLNGTYNNGEISYITSPCFDFSNFNNSAIISFDLVHLIETGFDNLWMEYSTNNGAIWTKLNPTNTTITNNWYNNSLVQAWSAFSFNNSWIQVRNDLQNLTQSSSIKFRYVLNTDISTVFEGAAVDNFAITQRADHDLDLISILEGQYSSKYFCNLGNQNISIEVKNLGLNPVDTFVLNFQVNNNLIKSDTIIQRINPGASARVNSLSKYNFSLNQSNVIKAWVELRGDTNQFNDTASTDSIPIGILNTKASPYFESFDFGHVPDDINFNSQNDSLGNDWIRETNKISSSPTDYSWKVRSIQTGSAATGPSQDHTGGNYLYTEASLGSLFESASLISPCIYIDSSIKQPQLTYFYHRYGSLANMAPLLVDAYSFGRWIPLDTIVSRTQTSETDPFQRREISLKDFKSSNIRLRFRAKSEGCCNGDMAIDAVSITDGTIRNIKNRSTNIITDSCNTDRLYGVQTSLVLYSDSIALPNTVSAQYFVNGVASTIEFIPDTLFPDSIYQYTFTNLGDFSKGGNYTIQSTIFAPFDSTRYDDTSLSTVKITSRFLPFYEGFENLNSLPNNCTVNLTNQNLNFEWDLSSNWLSFSDSICNFNNSFVNSGKYCLLSTPSNIPYTLKTPCFDLSNYNKVDLTYAFSTLWAINNPTPLTILYIEYINNNNWVVLDSTILPINRALPITYINDTLSLDNFIGQNITLRFRLLTTPSTYPDFYLDDIRIYDPTVTSFENEVVQKSKLLLYPNPNNGSFNLKISEELIEEEYLLLNISGQIIKRANFRNTNESIEIPNEQSGIYFLQVPNKGINQKVVVY